MSSELFNDYGLNEAEVGDVIAVAELTIRHQIMPKDLMAMIYMLIMILELDEQPEDDNVH